MTRKTERLMLIGAVIATLWLAAGTATAHGGYGVGCGPGCAAGCGSGPTGGARSESPGCGAVAGAWHGGHMGGAGFSLMTDEERAAHHAKMQALASYGECKAYITQFSKQLQDRAKEKGQTIGGPNAAMCDHMKAHGRLGE